ncbi:MAG: RNA methyltransferase [Acidobacteria bacterium]|nr:RNA methyltransferase [Acidobacteriota bacterium]
MTDDELTEIFIHVADPAWLLARGVFASEGRHVTRRLLTSQRFTVIALLLTPTAEAALAPELAALPPERRPTLIVKSQAELDALTKFRLHQGCVAFAERRPLPAWQSSHTDSGVSVLLERVRDPDNVGSIIRSASAMGVRAILMGPECADPFYRKAIRTSMGAVLTATVVAATPWPEVLAQLKASGHTLVATTPDPAAPDIEDLGPRTADGGPLVLLVGSEGDGLTPEARAAADVEARIPMTTEVDSLNVGVATAIAVYALSRRKTS